jgi:DNA-binding transcriptional LysR family regulator
VVLYNPKLFKDITQTKSLSKAAALNGMSQSAVSQFLRELERRLGAPLLDRSTRPLSLTRAGRLYADLCKDILRLEDEFRSSIGALTGRVEGEVRVASIYSIGLSEMTHLKEEFTRRYPDAKLQVEYLRPQKIYAALLEDKADLGLISYPEATKGLAVIPWREEEMAVAVSPSHPLAQTNILVPSDLEGHDFIGFDEDLTIRREIDRFFREQGVEIRMALQFDNIQSIKEAVALGSGVSILPARTFQTEIEQGRLIAVPLLAPELRRPVGIVHKKKKQFNQATQAFLELLREKPAKSPTERTRPATMVRS